MNSDELMRRRFGSRNRPLYLTISCPSLVSGNLQQPAIVNHGSITTISCREISQSLPLRPTYFLKPGFGFLSDLSSQLVHRQDEVEYSHRCPGAALAHPCAAAVWLCPPNCPTSGSLSHPWAESFPSSSSNHRRSTPIFPQLTSVLNPLTVFRIRSMCP